MEEQVQQSLAAGCTAHVSKPIRKATLLEAISLYTARGQAGAVGSDAKEPKLIIRVDAEFQEVIPQFLKSRHQDVESITSALAHGDFEAIRILGHRIKGIGGCYGFDGITDIGHALEQAAKVRDTDVIGKRVEELAEYLKRIDLVYE